MKTVTLISVLALFMASSCRTPEAKGNIVKTSGEKVATVLYNNTDTVSARKLSVFARLNAKIERTDVLPVELQVVTPDEKFRTDTLYISARNSTENKRYASGTCDLLKTVYENAVFQEKGSYTFKVRIINKNLSEYLIGVIIE